MTVNRVQTFNPDGECTWDCTDPLTCTERLMEDLVYKKLLNAQYIKSVKYTTHYVYKEIKVTYTEGGHYNLYTLDDKRKDGEQA